MSRVISPYYPPRAHWYGRVGVAGSWLRRSLALDRARAPGGISWLALLGSLLVPGLAMYIRGPRLYGRAALGACATLLLVFIAELGRPLANIAFGLLLAVHATGLNYLLAPWLGTLRFRSRVLFSMGLLVALGALLYAPAQNFVAARGFTPLRMNNRIVVVRAVTNPSTLRRGDWIAYTIAEGGDHGGYIRAGYGFGPVLAVGGDRVRFTSNAVEINGWPRPRLPHMPESGELVVPGNCWFTWPELDITGHGGVAEATLSQTLLSMATINESQLVGKPFRRWFWHRQLPL